MMFLPGRPYDASTRRRTSQTNSQVMLSVSSCTNASAAAPSPKTAGRAQRHGHAGVRVAMMLRHAELFQRVIHGLRVRAAPRTAFAVAVARLEHRHRRQDERLPDAGLYALRLHRFDQRKPERARVVD